MSRYFCIVLGKWMFCDWHLYSERMVSSKTGKIKWKQWRSVFNGKPDYENRRPASEDGGT